MKDLKNYEGDGYEEWYGKCVLQQAIRRAPPPTTAPGFYQAVHKLSVVVELLMGDIPERGLFRHPVLEKALTAYFEIVKGACLSIHLSFGRSNLDGAPA